MFTDVSSLKRNLQDFLVWHQIFFRLYFHNDCWHFNNDTFVFNTNISFNRDQFVFIFIFDFDILIFFSFDLYVFIWYFAFVYNKRSDCIPECLVCCNVLIFGNIFEVSFFQFSLLECCICYSLSCKLEKVLAKII